MLSLEGSRSSAQRICGYGHEVLERAKRFELSTPTLARLCSTTELRPRSGRPWPPLENETALMAEALGLGKASADGLQGVKPALVDVVLGGLGALARQLALEVESLPGFLGRAGVLGVDLVVEIVALLEPGPVLLIELFVVVEGSLDQLEGLERLVLDQGD